MSMLTLADIAEGCFNSPTQGRVLFEDELPIALQLRDAGYITIERAARYGRYPVAKLTDVGRKKLEAA